MRKIISIAFMLAVMHTAAQPWYWINPTTGHHRLNGISFAGPAEAMAVGNNGVILYYNGESWSHMSGPLTENLQAIHFLNPDFACAVGDNGTILHFNGLEWTQLPGPGQANLVDVCFVDESNGWAVGEEIWRFNGTDWVVDASFQHFNTVSFYDVNEGWAGGNNKLYKYNGVEWNPYDDLTGPGADIIISAMAITGPASGWLSGTSVGGTNKFYEYDGTTWTMVAHGHGPCYGLSFSDHNYGFGITNTGWAFTQSEVAVYKIISGAWEKVFEPVVYEDFHLTSVHTIAPNEAWVTDIPGFIYRGIDDEWDIFNGFATDTIHQISFPIPLLGQPASFGMAACGSEGIMRYENAVWTTEFTDQDFRFNQLCLDLYSPGFGFAAAYRMIPDHIPPWNYEARIYRYDSGNWTLEEPLPVELITPVTALYILDANRVWAASLHYLLHKTNGIWTAYEFPANTFTHALHFNSASDGWMAGKTGNGTAAGVIYRLSNSNWEMHYTTTGGGFNDLHVIDNNNIYAVGDNGLIAFYDGNTWEELSPLVTKDLFTVHINIDNTGWAAGEDGALLYFDGSEWSAETSLTDASIFDICFPEAGLGLMGGAKGAFFATQPQLPVGIVSPDKTTNNHTLHIYPNPAANQVSLSFHLDAPAYTQIEIFDLSGRMLLQTQPVFKTGGMHQQQLDVSFLQKGVYLISVRTAYGLKINGKLMLSH
jgi:photosystem II stability/assembly factor-like uncharacterized protein